MNLSLPRVAAIGTLALASLAQTGRAQLAPKAHPLPTFDASALRGMPPVAAPTAVIPAGYAITGETHHAHQHAPAHSTGHAHTAHAPAPHGHSASHDEHCHACVPGVYKTTVENFAGDGFVAKTHKQTAETHTFARSGHANCISDHAHPAYNEKYSGYYVGGGVGFFRHSGEEPKRTEGTWGWDYEGLPHWPKHVRLLWSGGRRYQGGYGQYHTEPPREIPNIFAIRYGERLHRLLGHGEAEGESAEH
jgi:hypothetical protein